MMKRINIALLMLLVCTGVAYARYPWQSHKELVHVFKVDLGGSTPSSLNMTNNFVMPGDLVLDTSDNSLYLVNQALGTLVYTKFASNGLFTITGDLTITGNGLNCPGDLLITPTGTEVHINGGLDVGGTSAVGDNNLNVVGTIVGGSTLTMVSTNGATTNVIITTGAQVDATKVANADLGDLSTVSGSWTLDAGVVDDTALDNTDSFTMDALTLGDTLTVVSTNGATTNVIITTGAQVDGETVADNTIDSDSIDWGSGAGQIDFSDLPGGIAAPDSLRDYSASSQDVTNGQAVTLSGIIVRLNSINGTNGATNTFTLNTLDSTLADSVFYVINTGTSNLLAIAQTGTWISPAITIPCKGAATIIGVSSNTFYGHN